MTEIDYGYQVEVVAGTAVLSSIVTNPYVIEVSLLAPDPNAYIEPIDYSRQGPLGVQPGVTEKPIVGGVFTPATIGAHVVTVPTGGDIVLDILKNGVSIFETEEDRTTIFDGTHDAVTGSWANVLLTDGDYLRIDIVAVGGITSGSDLVVSVRLQKVA